MSADQLPEGGEWATGSLLDKANVGKYVHHRGGGYGHRGGGYGSVARIAKVGRVNVHIENYGLPASYRVNEDAPGRAHAEYGSTVETDEFLTAYTERQRLVSALRAGERQNWRHVPLDSLRKIVALIEALGTEDALS